MDIKSLIKGVTLSLVVGVLALILSQFTPSWLNAILIALLLGVIINNVAKIPVSFNPGIAYSSSKLLELSVLFLAFNINFNNFKEIGLQSFVSIVVIVFSVLLFTIYLSKKLNCPDTAGWLIGFGTSICGSSAIAALASKVSINNRDSIGISMAVVNIFGTLGMLLFPVVLNYYNFNVQQIGVFLGTTLHSVGNVAGAGYSMGNEIGEVAITIKLARVALLSPGLLLFNFLINRNEAKSVGKSSFNLPWYLWGFIIVSILGSIFIIPKSIVDVTESLGKIALVIAMASIGLRIGFKQLIESGKRGLIFGLIVFIFQILLALVLVKYFL